MSVSGTTSGPELLVHLDRGRSEPLHRQLAEALRAAIRAGRITQGSRVPSTRVLAADLGVSRRLVVDTYGQLVAEGFLVSKRGSGTLVARVDTTAATPPAQLDAPTRYDVDFAPGAPDLAGFPRNSWLRALRQGLSQAPADVFGYVEPQGIASVRAALAEYLGRTRGVVADPARIVLCSGVTQGIGLIAQLLRRRGVGPLAMEDPGFWIHRIVLQHHGITPVPVRVDNDGIDVASLGQTRAAAVLTTPAHQSPTGAALSSLRRAALLEWSRGGNLIIEDDYDAEYRYDRAPVGALQGLGPDRVIYFGSASKTLIPGLRMGWMVLPPELVDPVIELKGLADAGNSVMDQIAFAEFLASGAYDRHLRQMRRRYQARRNTLLGALSRYLPQATVLGAAAGVHLTVVFPRGYPIRDLLRRAAERGVRVEPLSAFYADDAAAPPGLMLGYANLTESQIIRGIETLGMAAR